MAIASPSKVGATIRWQEVGMYLHEWTQHRRYADDSDWHAEREGRGLQC